MIDGVVQIGYACSSFEVTAIFSIAFRQVTSTKECCMEANTSEAAVVVMFLGSYNKG